MGEQNAASGIAASATHNRGVFEDVLDEYVGQKLAYFLGRLEKGEREVWFDATECVWCVFDDPSFERCEQARESLYALAGDQGCADGVKPVSEVQIYWSMGDVVMPCECDTTWVARRIASEAARQLEAQRYLCEDVEHLVEDELHVGLIIRRPPSLRRFLFGFLRRSDASWRGA